MIFGRIKQIFQNLKKKKFIILLLIMVIFAGGFFYWLRYWQTPFEEWDKQSLSRPQDYTINELPEEIMVENKKAGLSFQVPKEWRVEEPHSGNYLAVYSPGAIGRANSQQGMDKGCEVVVSVMGAKTNIDSIKKRLQELHQKWEYPEQYEIVSVSGFKALKNITGLAVLDLYGIGVHVPRTMLLGQSKVYYLSISANNSDKDKCFQEFEQFLKTVSIE